MLSISLRVFQSFEIYLLRVLCLGLYPNFFLIGLFVHLMSSFLTSLYILEISPLSDVGWVKIFSRSVGCYFVLLTVSFALQKLFSSRRSHLLFLSVSVLLDYIKKVVSCANAFKCTSHFLFYKVQCG